MAAQLSVTTADIKSLLVISVSTYDDNIQAIIDLWDITIEDMIQPAHLADSSLTSILTTGKKCVIAGHVQNRLPTTATGATSGSRVTVKMGQYEETTETKAASNSAVTGSTGDGLIQQGWDVLAPYLTDTATAGSMQVKSNLDTAVPEFTITHKNSEGETIGDSGSMEDW